MSETKNDEIRINTSESVRDKKNKLNNLLSYYLASQPQLKERNKTNEVEIRFGTRQYRDKNGRIYNNRPISKIDYDNVIQKLYSAGFKCDKTEGQNYLRIMSEYIEPKTGNVILSRNTRTELTGLDLIQEYCKTNSIRKLLENPATVSSKIKITQKMNAKTSEGEIISDVLFEDYNYSISYKVELDYSVKSQLGAEIVRNWEQYKKVFRFINRVRFYHEEYPIFVDLSILKTSKKIKRGGLMIPEMTVQEAGVFTNPESYEIELEIDNERMDYNMKIENLLGALRQSIRIVLGGIQGTNYPIPYSKARSIIHEYMYLIHGSEYEGVDRITSRNFIGPNSYTLQLGNIIEPLSQSNIPNIRKNYTVTDKADGQRKLLFINSHQEVYLIDTNMNITFTGVKTRSSELSNTLIDGEHILHDKYGRYINLYAAFDIYFLHGKDVRGLPFYIDIASSLVNAVDIEKGVIEPSVASNVKNELEQPYRLKILSETINNLQPVHKDKGSTMEMPKCDMEFICKEFKSGKNIFESCAQILNHIKDERVYRYNTDGLIFTPADFPVGGDEPLPVESSIIGNKYTPYNYKNTWKHSFKWKEPKDNTIDFLVTIKKDKKNADMDEVNYIYEEGNSNISGGMVGVKQYKVLELRCGFKVNTHAYVNPFNMVVEGVIPSPDTYIVNSASGNGDRESYQPVKFQPTNPSIENAYYCNIELIGAGEGGKEEGIMKTENGEVIEEDMIVEFRYNLLKPHGWRWEPVRVRYDKTSELRAGGKNYGNSYEVANSNWYSIHHPIDIEVIKSGDNIPDFINDEIYYNNRNLNEILTQGLRNFHNLFVKRKLIGCVANKSDKLIDFAVGKGGDIPKWIENNISFVFGVDLSKDNITNQMDGICARYLNALKTRSRIFKGMFVNGDSGLNIRSGEGMITERDKSITRAVFGMGEKDKNKLGLGVYEVYGMGEDGFEISSCQFAMHYFFGSEKTVHKFLQNVSENTKVGGAFIATCYDGDTIFKLLKNKSEGESVSFYRDGKMICDIVKMYPHGGFPEDYTSVGYKINVYQETINKYNSEYLVNFQYLINMMELYGFVLDVNNKYIPGGTTMFNTLFDIMKKEAINNKKLSYTYKTALKMSEEEKNVSFLNRCFVFRKIYKVDSRKIAINIMRERKSREEMEFEYLEEQTTRGFPDDKTVVVAKEKPGSYDIEVSAEDLKKDDIKVSPRITIKKPVLRKILNRNKKFIIEKYSPIITTPENSKSSSTENVVIEPEIVEIDIPNPEEVATIKENPEPKQKMIIKRRIKKV